MLTRSPTLIQHWVQGARHLKHSLFLILGFATSNHGNYGGVFVYYIDILIN